MLDNPRLASQLIGLERRTARGGRDSIDHAPGGRDDLANAAAGALVAASDAPGVVKIPPELMAWARMPCRRAVERSAAMAAGSTRWR